ncbi:G2/mitotic-specific cyclin-B-like [Ornithodoros turicata]|uniref:G2/mitotic-specific cyclin-B-like n=1 Tax=Ornithodoros turicata TaxID=34597 RepID=UPI00313873DE
MATRVARSVLSSDNTSATAAFKKPSLQQQKVGPRPLGSTNRNVPVLKPARPLAQNATLSKQLSQSNSLAKRDVSAKPLAKENRQHSADSILSISKLSVKEADTRPAEPLSYSTAMLPAEVTDIDALDSGNVQLCSQYAKEIYNYLSELELQYPIRPNFLGNKREIKANMRSILVNWLVQVHAKFNLLQETLYLTIAVLDRYLQAAENISRSKLQLIGVTAMFIAAKYEEMYSPDIMDYIYISDNAFTKRDILKMEIVMLEALDFSLGRPLPLHFLRRASKAGNVTVTVHSMAKYLLELTVTDYSMAHIRPSLLAATSLWLSLQMVDDGDWTTDLAYYGRYTKKEMEPVASKMCRLVMSASSSSQNVIYNKYKSPKFQSISNRPELHSELVRELAARP